MTLHSYWLTGIQRTVGVGYCCCKVESHRFLLLLKGRDVVPLAPSFCRTRVPKDGSRLWKNKGMTDERAIPRIVGSRFVGSRDEWLKNLFISQEHKFLATDTFLSLVLGYVAIFQQKWNIFHVGMTLERSQMEHTSRNLHRWIDSILWALVAQEKQGFQADSFFSPPINITRTFKEHFAKCQWKIKDSPREVNNCKIARRLSRQEFL